MSRNRTGQREPELYNGVNYGVLCEEHGRQLEFYQPVPYLFGAPREFDPSATYVYPFRMF